MTQSAAGLSIRGIIPSLCTPCTDDGDVDLPSHKRLVEFAIEKGVDGVSALLGNGEFFKFTDEERRKVVDATIDAANGKVPVYIGTSAVSTEAMVEASRYAADAGAQCIIVLPPFFSNTLPNKDEIAAHFFAASKAVGIPLMLQDATPFGVTLSPAEMMKVGRAVPNLRSVKIEGADSLTRIKATVKLAKGRITVLGGKGGVELAEELDAHADGNIPGCSTPEIWVQVLKTFNAEGSDKAHAIQEQYRDYLSYVFTGQHGHSYMLEKVALKVRGVISSEYVRAPRGTVGKSDSAVIGRMLREHGLM
jgi:dihydrodipicolinate synthase/N-acetylneuraminate lyase